jgi:hypothetical protein
MASQLDLNSKKIINLGAPSSANDAARKTDVDTTYTNAISRANHTGTQLASTISNFDTQVRTSRLDQMAAPTSPVSMNSQRLTSVLDPTSAQDAATKNYVDSQLAGIASSQTPKGAVRAAPTSNVSIASPGATIDGVTAASGDIFLLTGQTTGSENGPYIWNGAAVAMTRAGNWDSTAEAVLGSYWIVREGTHADSFALMTNDTAFTLGTTVLAVTFISATPAGLTPYESDLGDGSSVSFTCTHNFGTKAVNVVVFRNASPYDEVDVCVKHTSTNVITVEPDDVWSSAQMHVVISKM